MEWLTEFGRRLLMLVRRKQFENDLEEEMRLHRELREQEQIEAGVAPDEARYATRRRFGNEIVLREESREMWGWSWLENIMQDLRFGLRTLGNNPGFALVAIASLGLGIGANTAIFQLIDAVRLRSLPVPNPQELAEVRIVGGNGGMGVNNGSYAQLTRPIWQELREHHEPFSGVFAWGANGVNVGQGSETRYGIHIGSAEGTSKFTWVSPGYFQTMGIPLVMGRDFNQNDTSVSQRVAVVNQTFVRGFLGSANPIGKTLRTEPEPNYPSTVYEIVGVVPDTQYNELRGATPPMTFAPASQFPAQGPWTIMMIHSNAAPAVVISTVRRTIAEKHPEIVTASGDFQTWIRDGLVRERLLAMLSGFFGFLAALLAMVGLYGVISYVVARRRNEIGIRMALGAHRAHVVGMVMREACRLLAIGVVTGTVLSLVAGRWASSLLFGLKPYDPLTLVAAGALLGVIASLASFLPARRASKLDPMAALRYD